MTQMLQVVILAGILSAPVAAQDVRSQAAVIGPRVPGPVIPPPQPAYPPFTITGLTITDTGSDFTTIEWSSPDDPDDPDHTATAYDVRFSIIEPPAYNSNQGWFDAATPVDGEPGPLQAGTIQDMTISGLTSSTVYYVAIRSVDDGNHWSDVSNIVMTQTNDTVEPPVHGNPTDDGGASTSSGTSSGGGCSATSTVIPSIGLASAMIILALARGRRSE